MNTAEITRAVIHPAIGIARVGDSPEEFFVGPEVPHPPVGPPDGGYRDPEGRLKRQAARFRIYGFDCRGEVVGELTTEHAAIEWTVHVANKKGAWYDFEAAFDLPEAAALRSQRRNRSVRSRQDLVIDGGPRTIAGVDAGPVMCDGGRFLGADVHLGDLRTDESGRLLFLGGTGKSGSPTGARLVTFANNSGWYDDIADGPVTAQVRIGDRSVPVESAWVVSAPPNYAPDIVTPQTLWDVIRDALTGTLLEAPVGPPSFQQDILPVLAQFCEAQWVNFGFLRDFGWGAEHEFVRPDLLAQLADASVEARPLRREIFDRMRDPEAVTIAPNAWPPIYGDAFGSFANSPRIGLSFTATRMRHLRQWAEGDFAADYDPEFAPPATIEEVPLAEQPETLDRAALHFCLGGSFHPGCELTWTMRRVSLYVGPLRLRRRPAELPEPDYGDVLTAEIVLSENGPLEASGPGDLTKWMAVPWQTDTASCRSGYDDPHFRDPYVPSFWPARVPNHVLVESDYRIVMDESRSMEEREAAFRRRADWFGPLNPNAGFLEQIARMVSDFGRMGLVERRPGPGVDAAFPQTMYVEHRPNGPNEGPVPD